jgi:hypothetical protein
MGGSGRYAPPELRDSSLVVVQIHLWITSAATALAELPSRSTQGVVGNPTSGMWGGEGS